MTTAHQEILVRVIAGLAVLFVVWKNFKKPILSALSSYLLKHGKVALAMKLRPAMKSAGCAGDCDCSQSSK